MNPRAVPPLPSSCTREVRFTSLFHVRLPLHCNRMNRHQFLCPRTFRHGSLAVKDSKGPGPFNQCFAKCPFTCQIDWLSDQLCQSLDRLSDHFAKHCFQPLIPACLRSPHASRMRRHQQPVCEGLRRRLLHCEGGQQQGQHTHAVREHQRRDGGDAHDGGSGAAHAGIPGALQLRAAALHCRYIGLYGTPYTLHCRCSSLAL